jgi:hypothetical protein
MYTFSTFMTAIRRPSLIIPLAISIFILVMDETTTVIALSKGAVEVNPLGFNPWTGLIGTAYFIYISLVAIVANRKYRWFPIWIIFIPYIYLGIQAVVNNIVVIRLI